MCAATKVATDQAKRISTGVAATLCQPTDQNSGQERGPDHICDDVHTHGLGIVVVHPDKIRHGQFAFGGF